MPAGIGYPPGATPAIMEAMRRRVGQQPNLTGIGAAVGNQMTPANPLAQRGAMGPGAMSGVNAPQPPAMASQPGREQLPQSKPGEAELIIKALSDRLKRIA